MRWAKGGLTNDDGPATRISRAPLFRNLRDQVDRPLVQRLVDADEFPKASCAISR
jgi:hypothetical protein